ncbi:MAG: hypothetical protein KUG77_14430, partial [Nannocystaceae bacterium]|nr:hypothetical protein [Nannocystaceae bacterium]
LEDQIVNRLEQRKLHQGRRELKEELLGKYEVVDNIKPTLGPEPERKRAKSPRGGGEHGHGGKMKLGGKAAAAKGIMKKADVDPKSKRKDVAVTPAEGAKKTPAADGKESAAQGEEKPAAKGG